MTKGSKVKLRSYIPSDYPLVKKTIIESFGPNYSQEWDTKANLNGKIKKSPGSIIVAEIGGNVIGTVFIVDDHWAALISRLAVMKNYRGNGIGLLLMKEAERRLVKSGIKAISIFVNDEKTKLKRYYKENGYTQTGVYRFMYKIPKNK